MNTDVNVAKTSRFLNYAFKEFFSHSNIYTNARLELLSLKKKHLIVTITETRTIVISDYKTISLYIHYFPVPIAFYIISINM